MLIVWILSLLCLGVGFAGAWLNAHTPLQQPFWLGIPIGVVLIAFAFGGVVFG